MANRDSDKLVSAAPSVAEGRGEEPLPGPSGGDLASAPPPSRWEDWMEASPTPGAGPRKTRKVPFTCDQCGAGCGMLATVDLTAGAVVRIEGNPLHPSSEGRVCASGLAVLDQLQDPHRILHPMRRVGARGEGRWEKIGWEEALDQVASKLREAIEAEKLQEILVHMGTPEADPFTVRALASWGLDNLVTDTTAGSPQASLGHQLWFGSDRAGVDLEQAAVILLVGSPRDGSPLHPDPARVIAAKRAGAKLIVVEPVRSNLGAMADLWLPALPGTEAVLLLAFAHHIIRSRAANRDFMRRWWNWQQYMEARYPNVTMTFPRFELALQKLYQPYSFEFAERECGVSAARVQQAAEWVAGARTALATWCGGAATEGNLGGWQVPRTLFLLNALLGAVGTSGGVSPGAWWRFLPELPWTPPGPDLWHPLAWPGEFPLAAGPASPLLPHLLRSGRGKLSVYLTDRFNPVGSGPDGLSWVEALRDEALIQFHAALTPVWTETAQQADLVLPVGFGPERHGLVSSETRDARWISLQQPAVGVARAVDGVPLDDARRCNPGQVWDEIEWWMALAWKVDPGGEWGIRESSESRQFPGERLRVDELLGAALERGVPELGEAAVMEGGSALHYMRRRGAFQVDGSQGPVHERIVLEGALENVRESREGRAYALRRKGETVESLAPQSTPEPDSRGRVAVGLRMEGDLRQGFNTPSGRLEFYSPTLTEWGWPEYALPIYTKSHVHRDILASDELILIPLFEAPAATGSLLGAELAHVTPLWLNPADAARLGLSAGASARVETEIGHFVTRAWPTESVRPGVVAINPTRGRWHTAQGAGPNPATSALVSMHAEGDRRSIAREEVTRPEASADPRLGRVWWSDAGTPANLAMPVHPDPISGGHCWNQVVRVRPAQANDLPGDASADLGRADRIVELWLQRARRAEDVSPDKTRRPSWLIRTPRPMPEAWKLP